MSTEELLKACRETQTGSVQLVSASISAPFKGRGWPRAELLCINGEKQSVWLYDTKKLLRALEARLGKLQAITKEAVQA